jgi:hypothetical protein
MSLTTAGEREWDEQRAIFRQRGAGQSGEDGAADEDGRRDVTEAGYYANGVIEGLAQSLRLTLEHLHDVFNSPTIKNTFCGEARLAIPVHARRMLDHLAQIDWLITQD